MTALWPHLFFLLPDMISINAIDLLRQFKILFQNKTLNPPCATELTKVEASFVAKCTIWHVFSVHGFAAWLRRILPYEFSLSVLALRIFVASGRRRSQRALVTLVATRATLLAGLAKRLLAAMTYVLLVETARTATVRAKTHATWLQTHNVDDLRERGAWGRSVDRL
jgi:hypothetical protein